MIQDKYPRSAINRRDSDDATSGASPIFELQDVTYSYDHTPTDGYRPTAAIKNVNLGIMEGDSVAIIGPNGSGKTTLSKHLNGLLKPQTGQVHLCGKSVTSYRPQEMAEFVGYVFQNPDQQIFAKTVREEVGFTLHQFGRDPSFIENRVSETLELLELAGCEDFDPTQLTKGQRQRIALASVLVTKPQILVLDEPTTGLDKPNQEKLMGMLRRLNLLGHTIIFITHSLSLVAEYARRVIVLDQGEIVYDGPTSHIFENKTLLENLGFPLPPLVVLSNRLGYPATSLDQLMQYFQAA
jgi:energy-coupling factor transport system ATP-binding protein